MKLAMRMLAVVALGTLVSGCIPVPGQTRVVAALTGGTAKALVEEVTAGLDVDVNAMQSFVVTVNAITLDTEADEDAAVLFLGSMDVDLLDLTGVSQVISNALVEPGTYTKIRLSISNPRMRLLADPDVEITDIHLTANGRLFVSQTFEVPEGQTSLILLDFGGVHLVQQGNGGYTLTPQLSVNLSVQNAEVLSDGDVLTNDTDTQTLTLNIGGGSILIVHYTGADIFLVDDGDTPTGVAADLAVGATIHVDGLLQADGSVNATAVYLVE